VRDLKKALKPDLRKPGHFISLVKLIGGIALLAIGIKTGAV